MSNHIPQKPWMSLWLTLTHYTQWIVLKINTDTEQPPLSVIPLSCLVASNLHVFQCLFIVPPILIPLTHFVTIFKSYLCDYRSKHMWHDDCCMYPTCSMKPKVATTMWSDLPPVCQNIIVYIYVIHKQIIFDFMIDHIKYFNPFCK